MIGGSFTPEMKIRAKNALIFVHITLLKNPHQVQNE